MNETVLAEQIFFAKEAADYLGITPQRLSKLIQEGKIKPLKKNNSGTIFHIDELNRRKEEVEIFKNVSTKSSENAFKIDTKVKQEALNYSTLMNVLEVTEKELEPKFIEFGKLHSINTPIDLGDMCKQYASYFGISEDILLKEYQQAKKSFLSLKKTDEILKKGNEDYPPMLAKTKQAPRFLYIRGKKSLLYETRTIALVGSRQASDIAKDNTKQIAEVLGKNGITVVSGLAKGIDATAHDAALNSGYNTIAVIGTNLNQYYPPENKEIQLEIEKKGLVVSQFSPASKTKRCFFPLRNGVLSGLSLATIVMEANKISGALKQVEFAMKQKRQVLIPESVLKVEDITWPARYIEKGAKLVRNQMDILRILSENNIFKLDCLQRTMQQTLEGLSI